MKKSTFAMKALTFIVAASLFVSWKGLLVFADNFTDGASHYIAISLENPDTSDAEAAKSMPETFISNSSPSTDTHENDIAAIDMAEEGTAEIDVPETEQSKTEAAETELTETTVSEIGTIETGIAEETKISETDAAEIGPSEADAADAGPQNAAYPFDPQPATMEEIQSAIDAYEADYQNALSSGGIFDALAVQKPHWEFKVDDALMPVGWRCDSLVDEDYGITFWTFFPVPAAITASIATAPDLQAEIDAVSQQGTIVIDGGFSFEGTVVTIPSGKDITIKSEGGAVTLTQAYASTRHFSVYGELTLEGINLDGMAAGGGVHIDGGSLTMTSDSVIQNCQSVNGGGIYIHGGSAVLRGVVVINSSAEKGGGIYTDGSLTLIDSSILNNSANGMAGGVYSAGSLRITDSIINNNRVDASVSARGGGVYAGGATNISGEVEIIGNRIYNPATTSVSHMGGGIYAAGAISIEGSSPGSIVIANNHIDGLNINTNASGGGIYAGGGAAIVNALVSGNSTKRIGGGITVGGGKDLTLDNTTISGNWTTYSHSTSEGGGGVYMSGTSGGTVTITMQNGAKISGNGINDDGNVMTSYGGGIMGAYDLLITGGEISGNASKNNAGGIEVYFGNRLTLSGTLVKENWSDNGGGVYFGANGGYSNVTLLLSNGARITGNGIDKNGAVKTNYGGGVSSYGNPYYNLTLTIDASGNGGDDAIVGNKAKIYGGGVFYGNNLKLIDVTLSGNSAPDGGGIYVETQCSDNTDAEGYVYTKAIDIIGGTISGNTASGNGGGICAVQTQYNNRSSLSVNLTGVNVSNNTAGGSGGGIYNGMPFKPYYSQYTYRLAASVNTGGGTVISGNTAQKNGGGINIDVGIDTGFSGKKVVSSEIAGGTAITDNTAATGSGGGIYMLQHENLSSAADTAFSGNRAAQKAVPNPYTASVYPAIRYSSTSIMDNGDYVHPLNDYDINPRDIGHLVVTYHSNGGDGGPYDDIVTHTNTGMEFPYTVLNTEDVGMSRAGARFAKWNTQHDGGGANYDPGNIIMFGPGGNETLELYALWEINKHTVIFYDEDGTSVISELEYDYGDSIIPPGNPSKSPDAQYSYSFTGWRAGGDYTVTDAVTQDMTFTAVYSSAINQYTVTFYDEGGTSVISELEYDYGDSIIPPGNPSKSPDAQYSYSFTGWLTGGDYTVSDAVTQDMTFTAVYSSSINQYTVTFYNYDGITVLSSHGVDYGESVTPPAEPARQDDERFSYSFKGWIPGGSYTLDRLESVTRNMTFTADYNAAAKTFTVSFESNGGSEVASVGGVQYGGTIAAPANPARTNYSFNGWYRDNETFQNKWDFDNDTVTGDVTLYAGWKALPYEYEYDDSGYNYESDDDRIYIRTDRTPLADNTLTEVLDEDTPLSDNPYTGGARRLAMDLAMLGVACILSGLIVNKRERG